MTFKVHLEFRIPLVFGIGNSVKKMYRTKCRLSVVYYLF